VKVRLRFIMVAVIVALFSVLFAASPQVQVPSASRLPDQLTDQEFWTLVNDLSEPSGPYTGDTWVSNESSIQDVIPPVKQLAKPGGVYMGVGPEQNFTYMWALQSKMGFIIDIRRQNMLEILMLKAIFEISPDRADYVANLFSRRRPAGLNANTSAKDLMTAFASAPGEGLSKNVEAVRNTLARHGYKLTDEELLRISFIQDIFNRGGLEITAEFASPGSQASLGGAIPVTFTQLMTATDKNGQPWSFLSSEAAYQYVKELHRKNLIIPVVGDFAGPSTIRKIGDYLKQRNSNVGVFYLSNVEYYLNGPTMRAFQSNLASLPIDASSMLIRWSPRSTAQNLPWATPAMGVATMLQPASEFVDLIKANRAPATWPDVLRQNKDPQFYAASAQDPSLRRVTGRVTGISGLKPGEIVRVELIEGLRPGGFIVSADVAADGSFEIRNVSSRTYQAIVMVTCRSCSTSKVAAAPVNIVVADKDIADLRIAFVAQ
jgi:hypothetical protein